MDKEAKKPYVPTVDYVNNPKISYRPPSVLRRLAAINKRNAKKADVKEGAEMQEAKTGSEPGWMLKADPKLARRLKEIQKRKRYVPAKSPAKNEEVIAEVEEKSSGESKRVKKIMAKYKGMKNKFNAKPTIDGTGSSTVSSHIAGDEHVNS